MKSRWTSGFSLIEVLIAMGILSVVVMTMTILSQNMGRSVQRGNIGADADRLIASVQNLLNQTGDPNWTPSSTNAPCDDAMRNSSDDQVVWDPIGTPGTKGVVDHIVANGTVLAKIGGAISNNLMISNMYLREPNPAANHAGTTLAEGQPVHSRTARGTDTYDTVVAKLVIEFNLVNSDSVAGGKAIQSRMADVVVAIHPTTKKVSFCFNNQPIMASRLDCSAGGAAVLVDCDPTNPRPAAPSQCAKTYNVEGFDSTGNPICTCTWTCSQIPMGITTKWQPTTAGWYTTGCGPSPAINLAGQYCPTAGELCADHARCGAAHGLAPLVCHGYVCN